MSWQWAGPVLALTTFTTIGFGHVLVRRLHARYGTRFGWPLIGLGLLGLGSTLYLQHDLLAGVVGLTAVTIFWDGVEIFRQEKRMQRERALRRVRS